MFEVSELFPEGDFQFQLKLRRGDPGAFFAAQDPTGTLLAERRQWFEAGPELYTGMLPEAGPVLTEFLEMAADLGWGSRLPAPVIPDLVTVGCRLEPDVLLLLPDRGDGFRLGAGAICFPTDWALHDKLGRRLETIHEPVPGLNQELATPIHQLLAKLRPGIAYQRDNWGLAASAELNRHPARALPGPSRPVELASLWLRVEHQALVALPCTGGILFGIRLSLHRLDRLVGTPAAAGLRRALATMPEAVAVYKRLAGIRGDLLGLLA